MQFNKSTLLLFTTVALSGAAYGVTIQDPVARELSIINGNVALDLRGDDLAEMGLNSQLLERDPRQSAKKISPATLSAVRQSGNQVKAATKELKRFRKSHKKSATKVGKAKSRFRQREAVGERDEIEERDRKSKNVDDLRKTLRTVNKHLLDAASQLRTVHRRDVGNDVVLDKRLAAGFPLPTDSVPELPLPTESILLPPVPTDSLVELPPPTKLDEELLPVATLGLPGGNLPDESIPSFLPVPTDKVSLPPAPTDSLAELPPPTKLDEELLPVATLGLPGGNLPDESIPSFLPVPTDKNLLPLPPTVSIADLPPSNSLDDSFTLSALPFPTLGLPGGIPPDDSIPSLPLPTDSIPELPGVPLPTDSLTALPGLPLPTDSLPSLPLSTDSIPSLSLPTDPIPVFTFPSFPFPFPFPFPTAFLPSLTLPGVTLPLPTDTTTTGTTTSDTTTTTTSTTLPPIGSVSAVLAAIRALVALIRALVQELAAIIREIFTGDSTDTSVLSEVAPGLAALFGAVSELANSLSPSVGGIVDPVLDGVRGVLSSLGLVF
ncbi:hypothetical protein A4X09_0g2311 [Tilletia walkeri]|uniref:Uncharacterized protein n=1 Tax=Tilletia walkeri TaxID=117179 RepID=A0A8X7T679_9BASI|nr:hypothetical protein A4X09_0g2311 [Tilletia walkeri]